MTIPPPAAMPADEYARRVRVTLAPHRPTLPHVVSSPHVDRAGSAALNARRAHAVIGFPAGALDPQRGRVFRTARTQDGAVAELKELEAAEARAVARTGQSPRWRFAIYHLTINHGALCARLSAGE